MKDEKNMLTNMILSVGWVVKRLLSMFSRQNNDMSIGVGRHHYCRRCLCRRRCHATISLMISLIKVKRFHLIFPLTFFLLRFATIKATFSPA